VLFWKLIQKCKYEWILFTLRKQTSKTQWPNLGNKWINVNCGLPKSSFSNENRNIFTLFSPNTTITDSELEAIPCTRIPSKTENDFIIFPNSKSYNKISEPKPKIMKQMNDNNRLLNWNWSDIWSRRKRYRLEEEEESDWEAEESRELRCRQGKGHDADAIWLSVGLLPSPLLLLFQFNDTLKSEDVGFNKIFNSTILGSLTSSTNYFSAISCFFGIKNSIFKINFKKLFSKRK